jgi:hypothetical protein
MTEVNYVPKEAIDDLIARSEITVKTFFGKTTVVAMKLPNGFVLVESSSCVDPQGYDEAIGVQICKQKLESRLWELEGYRLQERLFQEAAYREGRMTDVRY